MRILPLLLLALFACRSTPLSAAPDASEAAPPTITVTVVTASGARHPVRSELALDTNARELGLMNRRSLGANDGMIFVFKKPEDLTFWMKNTLIPLDMIFIRSDGTIAGIVPDAAPLTETPRGVGTPTQYVLEVNGGWCAQQGVKAGDKVMLSNVPPAKD